MKKAIFCFLLLLIGFVSLAQTAYSNYLLNGDIKMKEHFYEMALSYYRKALSEASSPEEVTVAEQKIRDCNRMMASVKEHEMITSSNTKLLFSDQYLETGDFVDEDTKEIRQISDEEDYPLSLYRIEVYRDALVIVSHEDEQTSTERKDIPAGTVLPLVEETSNYRRFSSGEDGENFIVFKKVRGNSYGQYRLIFREQDEQYYVLYPMAYVKKRMNIPLAEKSQSTEKGGKEKQGENQVEPIITHPITFTESWVLNLDGNGELIGDSRIVPLHAREVCWLMFRLRYSCPDSFKESLRFDFKLTDSSGNLILCSGQGAQAEYSSSKVLDSIPGGGIFNIALGEDKPGSFQKGKYTLSLWCDKVKYYSVVIVLE